VRKHIWPTAACLAVLVLAPACQAWAQEAVVLENDRMGLHFDQGTGTLTALENKLSGETYRVSGDEFGVEAVELRLGFSDARLAAAELQDEAFRVRYESQRMTVEVTYTLAGENHFAEKRMTLTATRDYGLKNVLVSRPTFSAADLKMVEYRYPKFKRPPGTEPISTFFGRVPKGGFFTGVEMPFDASELEGTQVVLGYAPSLKVAAGERLECEPVYFGVYRRSPGDQEREGLPLESESDAMVAMTSAILGPPRHGLVPMACGWHSEMEHFAYTSAEAVEADMKSLDFLAECGVDWLSDSHPWGGETEKMNALVGDQEYSPGPLVTRLLEHAQQRNIKVVMWPTMNNTHPWSRKTGKAFRPDKPEWLMTRRRRPGEPELLSRNPANCLANRPFLQWLVRINLVAFHVPLP
jgi:hypothetical protein